ncbi:uncharacterized protein J7T54_003264 [Emericellopsis cladophorae]|uniref:Uncharacterized protein n=1 Tax=Emericellopsis cladophorae TaxID=2686198 RepID=A0A9Q0BCR9_9HYPO|nr:uncharacterized protein J7T54_003264 [Emericellopsis cladophorae]KAI6781097.1 hypothetical protein J7T54_003264 [Emericellopsis cladophorae]
MAILSSHSHKCIPSSSNTVVIGNLTGAPLSPLLTFGFMPRGKAFDDWRPANPATFGSMYSSVAMQLGLSVVLPLVVGQVVRGVLEKRTAWVLQKLYFSKVAGSFMLFMATFSSASKTSAIYEISKPSIIFDVFMNLALYMVFTAI